MLPYHYILKFDDDAHTMREGEGIPLAQVADLLESLVKALNPGKDEQVVLQDIVHASYGLALATNSYSVHNHLKVLHSKVGNRDYEGLNQPELTYLVKLKSILGGKFYLHAYDPQKADGVEVRDIKLPELPKYYLQASSVYGIITSIGSADLDGSKSYIKVAGLPFKIEVSEEQERVLIQHFKKSELRLSVIKRIEFSSGEIKNAQLEDFEALSEQLFTQLAQTLGQKYPDGLFNNIDDSAEYIRNLRTSTQ